MKNIVYYEKLSLCNEDEIFDTLLLKMKNTIRTYDFYVAWDKVLNNVSKIEILLNIMNSLIGKINIKSELKELIKMYPEVVTIIPILIAVRETNINIANYGGDVNYSFNKRNTYTDEEIDKIIFFAEKCGLLAVLSNKSIKNLVDYCIGVEVGLDTNARKNRSGTTMENLIEIYVNMICKKHNYNYLSQATVSKIKEVFGKDVPTDKSNRHFDFAIDTGIDIYLLEVNYYSSGGSKLKSVAGEFKSLFKLVTNKPNTKFIWITDGLGWNTAKAPLRETYNEIDFVFNINMIDNGLLEEVITKGL